jgi:hypothetical protein
MGLFAPLAVSGAGLAHLAAARCSSPTATDPIEDSLAALFSDREAARAVGLRYLAHFPAESDRGLLRRTLSHTLIGCSPTSPDNLRETLRNRCRQEFMTSATVLVDGWVLARSEARVYALVALGDVG